jgi:hypothetical protein
LKPNLKHDTFAKAIREDKLAGIMLGSFKLDQEKLEAICTNLITI